MQLGAHIVLVIFSSTIARLVIVQLAVHLHCIETQYSIQLATGVVNSSMVS